MARSRVTASLVQVALRVPPDGEEAAIAAFETALETSPSSYVDANTGTVTVSAYLRPRQWTEARRRNLRRRLHLLRSSGFPIQSRLLRVKHLRRENWAESWKKHFKPIRIGRQLLIRPSWSRQRAKQGQAEIILDPGLSFGTGHHATTAYCLRQLARLRRGNSRQSLLDVGTGSGILAIAACKLGYAPVRAFDYDPEAVRVSRENALRNGVAAEVRPVRGDVKRLPKHGRCFDVICANLMYDLLIATADCLAARLKAGGALILAGILKTQFPAVRSRFEELGFTCTDSRVEREWQSGRFEGALPKRVCLSCRDSA